MDVCLCSCEPTQVLSIDIAIDDFSQLSIYQNKSVKYDNECLKWSYSMDGIEWSCWLSYTEIADILFSLSGDYWIKTKIQGPIVYVEYDGNALSEWSTSLAKCFEFGATENPNRYNPYSNQENAIGLYYQLSENISDMIGIPIYYFKLKPGSGRDITFKEYSLMDIDSVKQIKMIIQDGDMPSSKPEFSEYGFDFSTDWNTEISKMTFASAFGNDAKPMEGDLIYVPMMKRMWSVNGAYDEKKDGFMWHSSTYNVSLSKYEDKNSVDLGDMQAFVDSLVTTKYNDLFGDDENRMSGTDTLSSPKEAFDPLYPVFKSDAVRKYVKHTTLNSEDKIQDLNSKLEYCPKYHNSAIVSENCYNWISNIEQSYIIYQKCFSGVDASVSFIIDAPSGKSYLTKLLDVGQVPIYISSDSVKLTIKVLDICELNVDTGSSYFVVVRWSKRMNIVEISAAKYTYPEGMPIYMVNSHNWKFDIDNMFTAASKYSIELEQCKENTITLYSFYGKITDIKVFDVYVDNYSVMLQMYPTEQSLLINDTARKFVVLQK